MLGLNLTARIKGLEFTHHTPFSRWQDTGLARYVFLPNSWNGSKNCSSSSAFYVNLPLEAVGRKIYLEPLGLNRAVCSNKLRLSTSVFQKRSLACAKKFPLSDWGCCCSPGQRSDKRHLCTMKNNNK